MTEQDLLQRTKKFAVRVLHLAEALPDKRLWWPTSTQLVRCGTSVGANDRAACRGRSKAEFLAKLGIVEEQTDEAMYWMELVMEEKVVEPGRIRPLYQEADELLRIFVASKQTAARSINRKSQIANRK